MGKVEKVGQRDLWKSEIVIIGSLGSKSWSSAVREESSTGRQAGRMLLLSSGVWVVGAVCMIIKVTPFTTRFHSLLTESITVPKRLKQYPVLALGYIVPKSTIEIKWSTFIDSFPFFSRGYGIPFNAGGY